MSVPRKPNPPLAILLGAGASVGAGLPTAREITESFTSFGTTFIDDPLASRTENLVRRIQLTIADRRGVAASTVDFEPVLGTLLELATNQSPESVAVFGGGVADLGPDGSEFARAVAERLFRLLREMLVVQRGRSRYLSPLLQLRQPRARLDIFTLNYDRTVEQMLEESRIAYVDGFGRSPEPSRVSFWDPRVFDSPTSVRLFKLHGSIDWGFLNSVRPPKRGEPLQLEYLRNYPRLTRFTAWHSEPWSMPGTSGSLVSALNIGTQKERLYVQGPFADLFTRLGQSLKSASTLIVAGYSFRDDRINRILEEAVVSRRGDLRLIVVDPQVHSVADNLPTLWSFRSDRVAYFLEQRLDDACSSGTLRGALETSVQPRPDVSQWASGVFLPSASALSVRDVDSVLASWVELQQHFDGSRFRWHVIERGLGDEISASYAGQLLEGFVVCVVELARGYDRLLASMDFAPYFRLADDAPSGVLNSGHRRPEGNFITELRKVGTYIARAYTTYAHLTDQFASAVQDPSAGADARAPDNFSMAEMVATEVAAGIRNLGWALNEALSSVGGREPLANWPT